VTPPQSSAPLEPPEDVDALVVGAGPVGLYAAYYAGFRGLSVAVLDSLPEIGGQVSAMYPEKLIYDVAGFPAVRGRDLIARLADQAAPYEPGYVLGEEARYLGYDDGRPVVTTSSGLRLRAGFVVVTGGIGRFTPRPLPALPSHCPAARPRSATPAAAPRSARSAPTRPWCTRGQPGAGPREARSPRSARPPMETWTKRYNC
jgi:NAD(P)-binding Rossmann-like domain